MDLYRKNPFWTGRDMLTTILLFLVCFGTISWILIRHDTPSHVETAFGFLVFMVCYLIGTANAHRRVISRLMDQVDTLKQQQTNTKT